MLYEQTRTFVWYLFFNLTLPLISKSSTKHSVKQGDKYSQQDGQTDLVKDDLTCRQRDR